MSRQIPRLIIPALVALLVSGPAWGETYFDLVQREGLYYKKFTEVPFSGTVTGRFQGKIKNGKKDGPWVGYWKNGQLMYKGTWKDGKREGPPYLAKISQFIPYLYFYPYFYPYYGAR